MKKRFLYIAPIFCIIGILIFNGIKINKSYKELYKEISNSETVPIEAIVISSAKEKEYSYEYTLKVLKINGSKQYKGIKLLLNVRKNKNENINYGDLIQLNGNFKIPNGVRNEGGFDYLKYLKSKRIYGTVITEQNIQVINKDANGKIETIIHKIQKSVKNNIKIILPKETEDLAIGILIGDKEKLPEAIEKDFKDSNLTHMLAVSGAHISYILLGINLVAGKLEKRTLKIIIILFLIFFMSLVDFTPSVSRAGIMAIMTLVSGLFYRKPYIFSNLIFSGIMILLENPYVLFDIGFQLSYGGTIGIVLIDKKILSFVENKFKNCSKILNYIIKAVTVTISANIIIIPIMAYQFNTVSLTFWLSNLLASPLMGISVIMGFVAYFISLISINLAQIIAIPLNLILQIFLKIAETCSKIPFSSVIVKTPYLTSIIIYYIVVLLILNYKKMIKKIKIKRAIIKIKHIIQNSICNKKILIITAIITILILNLIIRETNQELKIYFIDVGQGDSTLIITPTNKKILIDGGGSENSNFDVGEKVLLPYLLDKRITTLDYMIISHFDSDHVRTGYLL